MSRNFPELVATQTYCIFFTVYSIGAIKTTISVPTIFDSFFKWLTALSEMHQVRGGWVGGGARGGTTHTNKKQKAAF